MVCDAMDTAEEVAVCDEEATAKLAACKKESSEEAAADEAAADEAARDEAARPAVESGGPPPGHQSDLVSPWPE